MYIACIASYLNRQQKAINANSFLLSIQVVSTFQLYTPTSYIAPIGLPSQLYCRYILHTYLKMISAVKIFSHSLQLYEVYCHLVLHFQRDLLIHPKSVKLQCHSFHSFLTELTLLILSLLHFHQRRPGSHMHSYILSPKKQLQYSKTPYSPD